jgi:hypothetical protein
MKAAVAAALCALVVQMAGLIADPFVAGLVIYPTAALGAFLLVGAVVELMVGLIRAGER